MEKDSHFLTLVRYVERNAKKANLVEKAENWQWSSVWRREKGTAKQKKLLDPWPVPSPIKYCAWLNKPQTEVEEEAIERSIQKSSPYGREEWVRKVAKKLGQESTLREKGRPKKST